MKTFKGFRTLALAGLLALGLFVAVQSVRSFAPDLPVVTITAYEDDAAELGATGMFWVSRTGGDLSAPLVVYFETPPGGSAQNGTDYELLPGTLPEWVRIEANDGGVYIYLTPILDLDSGEGNETAVLTLATNANYWVGWPDSATVTIADMPADSDSDELSDAWEWWHFGNLNQTASGDYDGDGVINSLEFTNGSDPNTISYSVTFAANPVNSNTVPATLKVTGGVPAQMAVLVNSTNFASATWLSFGTNFIVSLGTNDGAYEVWVGLRGRSATSEQTWEWTEIVRDTVPPGVVITNPVSATNSRPFVQVQGYSIEPLATIHFDATNATGLVTNEPGYVTDQYFDTNLIAVTTNYFQCFDVELTTNSATAITVRVADLAGNVTSTNLSVMLDFANDTNPPAITLLWPTNGAYLGGSQFTLRGILDDETAQVTAQIVATNVTTNVVAGLVERNGQFWVDDLPLTNGEHILTLTVTDAAGNFATTNLTLVKSAIALVINPVEPSQLNNPTVAVSGTVSDASCEVTVNGVTATVDASGNWLAEEVPVHGRGMATFEAAAVPAGGGQPPTLTGLQEEQLPRIYTSLHFDRYEYQESAPLTEGLSYKSAKSYQENWNTGQKSYSASLKVYMYECLPNKWFNDYHIWSDSNEGGHTYSQWGTVEPDTTLSRDYEGWENDLVPNPRSVPAKSTCPPGDNGWVYHYYANVRDSGVGRNYWRSSRTSLKLRTGGRAGINRRNLIALVGTGKDYSRTKCINWEGWSGPAYDIARDQIRVFGKNLGNDGRLYVVLPDNLDLVLGAAAPPRHYNLSLTATKHKLWITANNQDCQSEFVFFRPTFIVGQYVTFRGVWDRTPENIDVETNQWTFGGTYYNDGTNAVPGVSFPTCSSNYFTNGSMLRSDPTTAWWVSGGHIIPRSYAVDLDKGLTFTNGQHIVLKQRGSFQMHRPDAVITATHGSVFLDAFMIIAKPPPCSYMFGLHYGSAPECGASYGIHLSHSTTIPGGFTGELNWCQVITRTVVRFQDVTNQWWRYDHANCLDKSMPTPKNPLEDSPGMDVNTGEPFYTKTISRSDTFDAWLMFQPGGPSVWVPLRKVHWAWSGEGAAPNWVLTNPSNPSPSVSDALDYPYWTNKIENFPPTPSAYTKEP